MWRLSSNPSSFSIFLFYPSPFLHGGRVIEDGTLENVSIVQEAVFSSLFFTFPALFRMSPRLHAQNPDFRLPNSADWPTELISTPFLFLCFVMPGRLFPPLGFRQPPFLRQRANLSREDRRLKFQLPNSETVSARVLFPFFYLRTWRDL